MFLFPNGFHTFSITQVYRFFNSELQIGLCFTLNRSTNIHRRALIIPFMRSRIL